MTEPVRPLKYQPRPTDTPEQAERREQAWEAHLAAEAAGGTVKGQ